jgi:hypothetical protein
LLRRPSSPDRAVLEVESPSSLSSSIVEWRKYVPSHTAKSYESINIREETEVKVFIKQVNQVKGFQSGERKAPRCDETFR